MPTSSSASPDPLAGIPRAGLRERKQQETRAALERAAVELAAQHGVRGVTIEHIAAAAGVSPRTFFNYFATKHEAIYGGGVAVLQMPAMLEQSLQPGTPAEVLRQMHTLMAWWLREQQEYSELWALRHQVVQGHPELMQAAADNQAALVEATIAVVGKCLRGLGEDEDPAEVSAAVVSLFVDAVRSTLLRGSVPGNRENLPALLTRTFALQRRVLCD